MRREAEHAGQHSPLANYLALAHHSESTLADSLRTVQQGHAEHPDVLFTCQAQEAMRGKVISPSNWRSSVASRTRLGANPVLSQRVSRPTNPVVAQWFSTHHSEA